MISLSKLRAALHPADDDLLPVLQASVIELWETQTKRRWQRQTVTEQFRQPAGRVRSLFLEITPVISITSVQVKTDLNTDWEDADAEDYEVLNGNHLRRNIPQRALASSSSFWPSFVQVTYEGGYDEDSTPADIEQVLLLQARFMTARNADGNIILRSQNFEGGAGVFERNTFHPLFDLLAKKHLAKRVQVA